MKTTYQFIRFVLVGSICVIFNLSTLYFLVDILGWHYMTATIAAFFAINGIGFWLNKYFTFRQVSTSFLPELLRYYFGMAFSFTINIMLMALFVSILKVHYLVASFAISVILVLLNFLMHKGWTFGLSTPQKQSKQFRIVLVTHYFPAHSGGVERVAWEIAKRWSSDDNTHIDWFASNTDVTPQIANITTHPVATWNGMEVKYGVPLPLWSPAVLPALWRSIRRADVVHIHDSLYMGNMIAGLMAWFLDKPLILTQHIGFVPYKSPFLRTLLSIANRTVAFVIMALSTEIIFISATVEQYFRSLWKWKTKPNFIPNGVETETYFPPTALQREEARNQFGLNTSRPTWLFVGRFVEKKGLLILKEMAESYPEADWIFAGQGPLDPGSWNLSNVKVFSGLSKETLRPLYWAADMLVLPSVGEGFPLVVQEAMACGLPIMVDIETANAYPDAQYLVFAEKVQGDDVINRWVNRLQQFKKNDTAHSELRTAVAEFALSHWSWTTCLDSYKALVNKCLSSKETDESLKSPTHKPRKSRWVYALISIALIFIALTAFNFNFVKSNPHINGIDYMGHIETIRSFVEHYYKICQQHIIDFQQTHALPWRK